MAKRRISHSKAAVKEAGQAGVDAISVVFEDLGRLRHGISAVEHGEKAIQHTKKAIKSAVRSRINKAKRALGLKPIRKPTRKTARRRTTSRTRR
jgi:hypothetical protein